MKDVKGAQRPSGHRAARGRRVGASLARSSVHDESGPSRERIPAAVTLVRGGAESTPRPRRAQDIASPGKCPERVRRAGAPCGYGDDRRCNPGLPPAGQEWIGCTERRNGGWWRRVWSPTPRSTNTRRSSGPIKPRIVRIVIVPDACRPARSFNRRPDSPQVDARHELASAGTSCAIRRCDRADSPRRSCPRAWPDGASPPDQPP